MTLVVLALLFRFMGQSALRASPDAAKKLKWVGLAMIAIVLLQFFHLVDFTQ
jgi:hypothetical protein